MKPLIDVRGLSKSYVMGSNTVAALRSVSLTIAEGEFVAIMGASGSGKSTFMNLLGCLDTPTAGEYRLAGEKVSDMSGDALAAIRNRRIGFVFQQFNLLPRTSALDNVQLPLLYAATPAAQRRQRAMARLSQVGLATRHDHHPSQLSGGQQQRVAIARALVNDPALILADEPTVLLQQLNAAGMTIVMVTHEADIAAFASRIITFRDGEIISDTPHTPDNAAAKLDKAGEVIS
jgi:putative ABC transport system ATP-binding protein